MKKNLNALLYTVLLFDSDILSVSEIPGGKNCAQAFVHSTTTNNVFFFFMEVPQTAGESLKTDFFQLLQFFNVKYFRKKHENNWDTSLRTFQKGEKLVNRATDENARPMTSRPRAL